ncbi:MAG: hypothetical protein K2W92_07715 [Alphaproteobacteria bacterium]|nr:hypothetical protein [Alphaproteobacteria bacterium]
MKQLLIVATITIGLSGLNGQKVKAQLPECYPLTSEEATAILSAKEDKIRDNFFDWKVEKVEQNFICVDYCTPQEIIVGPGTFNAGKCIYTLTNGGKADIVGQTSTIILKQVPKKPAS